MNHIYLRELSREDLPRLNQWRHQRHLIENLGAPFRYIGIESELQWFENYLKQRHNQLRLSICLVSNDQHIGNVYLLNQDAIHRQAEFSILIGDHQFHGKGYGYEATMMMLSHAFYDLNLHRIELQVVETNQRALSFYRKCGFQEEGRRRQAVYKQGKYCDMLLFSCLKPEFNKLWKVE